MVETATLHEISKMLNLSKNALYQQRARNPDFPSPVSGRLYDVDEILRWRESHLKEVRRNRKYTMLIKGRRFRRGRQ